MTFEEFMSLALTAYPGAYIGQDNDGQLIVYTGLKLEGGQVVSMD